MGQRLLDFYDRATKVGGTIARSRLAALTMVPSMIAGSLADSPELVASFLKALETIQRESQQSDGSSEPAETLALRAPGEAAHAAALRQSRCSKILSKLLARRAELSSNPELAYRTVTEAASEALDVDRASIWILDDSNSAIRCADLYERRKGSHSSGMELKKSDYPSYFTAMLWERTIAAHDAHKDSRTACFSKPYLEPLNIASMLDVPIWTNLGMGGILCHEQLDKPRRWLADEEDVAYSLAGFVAAVLSQH